MRMRLILPAILALSAATGCNPVVKVEAPDKPIVINMNLNIRQEVLIRLEKDVETLLEKDKGLF